MESYLEDRYIRFDWAIKRLLRQKANFGVLEGFHRIPEGKSDYHGNTRKRK